jgi:anti-sigma factor RsiW
MLTLSFTDCDRARESVSAELDGELPELERERLSAHLRTCLDCSVWAEQAADTVRRLREATLETPAMSFAPWGRRRRPRVAAALAVSSAAALVASLVVAVSLQNASLRSRPPVSGAPSPAQSTKLDAVMTDQPAMSLTHAAGFDGLVQAHSVQPAVRGPFRPV